MNQRTRRHTALAAAPRSERMTSMIAADAGMSPATEDLLRQILARQLSVTRGLMLDTIVSSTKPKTDFTELAIALAAAGRVGMVTVTWPAEVPWWEACTATVAVTDLGTAALKHRDAAINAAGRMLSN